MDNKKQGEELNQLSRLLFDKGARNWYLAIFIELIAGLFGIFAGLSNFSDDRKLIIAMLGFLLMILSYYLRISFEGIYDRAETMRRQSILSEALDWPISSVQFSDWRLKAGKDILKHFKLKIRGKNYYATHKPTGTRRLLDMISETAFWTRHLYVRLKDILIIILVLVVFLSASFISVSALSIIPNKTQLQIVYFVYLFLPIILSIDLLGWIIRLNRLAGSIKEIEEDLERLSKSKRISIPEIMRLASEYNCQVTNGFPIHPWMYNLLRNEVTDLWNQR